MIYRNYAYKVDYNYKINGNYGPQYDDTLFHHELSIRKLVHVITTYIYYAKMQIELVSIPPH